jgi:hypothetical protein
MLMRGTSADAYWEPGDIDAHDRIPAPLLGFVSGTLVSLGLWAVIGWVAFCLLR